MSEELVAAIMGGWAIGWILGWVSEWISERPHATVLSGASIQGASWGEINWLLADRSLTASEHERVRSRWYEMAGIVKP